MTTQTGILVNVSADGKLEIPPELQAQLEPLSRYEVLVTNNEIIFRKISKFLTWEELSQRIEAIGTDSEEPSLAKISEVVLVSLIFRHLYFEILKCFRCKA